MHAILIHSSWHCFSHFPVHNKLMKWPKALQKQLLMTKTGPGQI